MHPRFNGRSKFHPIRSYPWRWGGNQILGQSIKFRLQLALSRWHCLHGRSDMVWLERGMKPLERLTALREGPPHYGQIVWHELD